MSPQARFRPVYLLGDADDEPPRIFVELWDTRDWPEVQNRLAQLPDITELAFRQHDNAEACLEFVFRSHRFRFYRGCGDYAGVVDDPSCPDEILLGVADHLNRFLCPIT